MSASRLYNTYRWQRKREAQLNQDPICCYCIKEGRVEEATVADHIIPHRGDVSAFWNNELQSLCKHCHDSIKQREEHGMKVNIIGLDGWSL